MSHTFFVNSFSTSTILYLTLRLSSISFSFDGNFSTLRTKAIFSLYNPQNEMLRNCKTKRSVA